MNFTTSITSNFPNSRSFKQEKILPILSNLSISSSPIVNQRQIEVTGASAFSSHERPLDANLSLAVCIHKRKPQRPPQKFISRDSDKKFETGRVQKDIFANIDWQQADVYDAQLAAALAKLDRPLAQHQSDFQLQRQKFFSFYAHPSPDSGSEAEVKEIQDIITLDEKLEKAGKEVEKALADLGGLVDPHQADFLLCLAGINPQVNSKGQSFNAAKARPANQYRHREKIKQIVKALEQAKAKRKVDKDGWAQTGNIIKFLPKDWTSRLLHQLYLNSRHGLKNQSKAALERREVLVRQDGKNKRILYYRLNLKSPVVQATLKQDKKEFISSKYIYSSSVP